MRTRPHLALIALSALLFCTTGLCAEPPTAEQVTAAGQGAQAPAGGNGRVAVLIGFRNVPGPSEQALVRSQAGVIKYSYHLVPAIAASIPEQARAALLANPAVTRMEIDGTVRALDAELDSAWGVKRIGAGLVHDALNKGTGVKVAVIDTGIDYTHPDLDGNYRGGRDFVNSDDYPMDDHGHGTHVAGTIAAEDNDTGVVGVAPEAHLYALKILDSAGSGTDSDMIAAMEWAVDNGMDVVNLSLGTPTDPGTTVQQAFDNAAAQGIVTVAAAGNRDWLYILLGIEMPVQWPAAYDSVIAVSATTSSDQWADFSCSGPEVEVAAPGNSVYSTVPGGYGIMSGTSMAAPHVAGTAALVIAGGYADVRGRLAGTADDLGTPGRDRYYGYGLVDADEAAGGGTPPANQEPVASFTYTTADLSCSFDASTSTDPDGSIVAYAWSFGDGGSGSGVTTTHTYASAGTYTVTLTVTDNDGATNAASQNVTVSAPSNQPPTASFTYATTNLSCSFDASGSTDDGSIVAYAWSFGDGNAGSGVTTRHAYASAGTYTVTLTVTDDDGATDSQSRNVTVEAAPVLTMHVGSISLTREKLPVKKGSALYRVTARVLILDASGAPVSGAAVSGSWSGAYTANVGPAATIDGTASFTTQSVPAAKGAKFTFTVTDVARTGWEYDSSANTETSDSITVK